ncbi:hypothetical protein THRCLA_06956 [Thraustotheca clavata]|uniref:Secreted protein n=1 Tax=Thraustotheca clavata TaxID=74557 RepID=A0A1V9ZHG0_9STRA|nr:hypothetical protein THRCLA_06956 [Thraustotheca clavata]
MGWSLHAIAVILVALALRGLQEAWKEAHNQYVSVHTSRRIANHHRHGFWSFFSSQMMQRWMMWLPALVFLSWWAWQSYSHLLFNDRSVDVVDDKDVPDLVPIEGCEGIAREIKPFKMKAKKLLPIEDQVAANKRRSARAFNALLAQKEKFEKTPIERPSGWMVYDATAGKLVLANGDES